MPVHPSWQAPSGVILRPESGVPLSDAGQAVELVIIISHKLAIGMSKLRAIAVLVVLIPKVVLTLTVGEIVVERLVQLAMSGNARDLARFIEIAQKYAPEAFADEQKSISVKYERAKGSNVELPPLDLWEQSK